MFTIAAGYIGYWNNANSADENNRVLLKFVEIDCRVSLFHSEKKENIWYIQRYIVSRQKTKRIRFQLQARETLHKGG